MTDSRERGREWMGCKKANWRRRMEDVGVESPCNCWSAGLQASARSERGTERTSLDARQRLQITM